jgi:plasmid stability protein
MLSTSAGERRLNTRPKIPRSLIAWTLLEGQLSGEIDSEGRNCDTVSMKNITVSVDEETHRRARIRAAELDTSLSAAVRKFLIEFAGGETDFERRKKLQERTLASIRSFRAGDRLSREEAHRRHALR